VIAWTFYSTSKSLGGITVMLITFKLEDDYMLTRLL